MALARVQLIAAPTDAAGFLIRLGAPSRSDTIHRNDCPVIKRSKAEALRWNWADHNPHEDWKLSAPWLHACQVCKPWSPLSSRGNT